MQTAFFFSALICLFTVSFSSLNSVDRLWMSLAFSTLTPYTSSSPDFATVKMSLIIIPNFSAKAGRSANSSLVRRFV